MSEKEEDDGLEPLETESILGGGGWGDRPDDGLPTESEQKGLDRDDAEER